MNETEMDNIHTMLEQILEKCKTMDRNLIQFEKKADKFMDGMNDTLDKIEICMDKWSK